MNSPALSVVIITLNEEAHLPRLLSDLAHQTFQDFEVIHVDSRSNDATVELSKRWLDRFDNYRIIEMDRRGVSLGRNTGAAWKAKTNHDEPRDYLSVQLDDPSFPEPIRAALFEENGAAFLMWNRREG